MLTFLKQLQLELAIEWQNNHSVIKFLFEMGVTVTINQTLAADTAEYLVKEFGHNPIREEKAEEIIKKIKEHELKI